MDIDRRKEKRPVTALSLIVVFFSVTFIFILFYSLYLVHSCYPSASSKTPPRSSLPPPAAHSLHPSSHAVDHHHTNHPIDKTTHDNDQHSSTVSTTTAQYSSHTKLSEKMTEKFMESMHAKHAAHTNHHSVHKYHSTIDPNEHAAEDHFHIRHADAMNIGSMSAPILEEQKYSIVTTQLLSTPNNNHDPADPSKPSSFGEMYQIIGIENSEPMARSEYINYVLCSFTNVCADHNGLYFHFATEAQRNEHKKLFDFCLDTAHRKSKICACFHVNFQPRILPSAHHDFSKNGHYWSMNKWVLSHHIAHWAQKLLLFQSIYQHQHAFPYHLKGLDGMIFHDTELPVSDHEQAILNITILAALNEHHSLYKNFLHKEQQGRLMYRTDFLSSGMKCFRRITLTPNYGIFSTNSADTHYFRMISYKLFNVKSGHDRCPPRRIVMIYRPDRQIINWREMDDMLYKYTGHHLERKTVNATTSPHEQIHTFADYGLILSSHSSQLVNVMFTHPNAVMMEVTAEYYNADFAEYAHGMGVYFQYAFGGEVPGGVKDPIMKECIELLSNCHGDSFCVLEQRFRCSRNRNVWNKPLNFKANITAFEVSLKHSLSHLNWACGGAW